MINKETKNYRKIWEKAYGKIPKDNKDRSLEIHHINGDHSDNRLENLKLVTIKEHYDIHYSQGDYYACFLIAARMKLSKEELSAISRDIVTKLNKRRMEDGSLQLACKHTQLKLAESGQHNFNGSDFNIKRIEKGIHPCQQKYEHPLYKSEGSKAKGPWGNFCKIRGINFDLFKSELIKVANV